ncbi:MAG: nucleoside deaminase [Rhodobacterales bacterium]|nr:nucleoside deaminase [Rhodobacterales bacterium]
MTREDHLNRCIALAEEALAAGDAPFGSVLVGADGRTLHEARNRARSGDPTQHPEFELARWAAQNMTPEDRAAATVYTSGEHCPMCSAAHGWAGLGRIVYIHSSNQLAQWRRELGHPAGPVAPFSIEEICPGTPVEGPVAPLDQKMRRLHARDEGAKG